MRTRIKWLSVAGFLLCVGAFYWASERGERENGGVSGRGDGGSTGVDSLPVLEPIFGGAAGSGGVVLEQLPERARTWVAGEEPFRGWVRADLGSTDEAERREMLEEGLELVEARRAAFRAKIVADPRGAMESAVPMVVRQALPEAIEARLERRVAAVADVEVQAVSEGSGPEEPVVRYFTRFGGEELRTYVYGRRTSQNSLKQVPVNGVAIDGVMALNESPLRVMELGERPGSGVVKVETCPVSGITTAIEGDRGAVTEATPAVEVGDQIVYLCDGGHIRVYEEGLIAAEGGTGGALNLNGPAASSFSNGPRSLLYMRVVFPDDLQEPQTEAQAWEAVRQLNSYFAEISYGKIFYLASVTPTIVLPRSEAWYAADYTSTGSNSPIMNDAKEAARAMGYNPDNFQHFTVIYSGGPGSFGGLGSVGGANVWLRSTGLGVFCHEIGHNVGLWHGNYWNTSGRNVIGGGSNAEYGHSYDVLGSSGSVTGNKGHFMAHHKNIMNWLPNEQVATAVGSGVHRLYPMDQTILDPEKRYALKVAKDGGRDYWVDFRQKYNADHRWFRDGVLLHWGRWGQNVDVSAVGSNRGGQLLDTTPGSADGKNDAPIVMGRTFSDRESGIHITPLGKGGTTPESMDVQVHVGDFPGNSVPVINVMTASTVTPAVNGTVTFTVDATDVDGDSLAYFWDFGDATYGENAAATSKQFTTARHHAVRCIVSDMKGGEVSRLMLITVGAPTTFTAVGRVVDGLGNPMREVRVDNGATGTSFRGGWTDSNGDFAVTQLAGGSVTLTPVQGGFGFAPASRTVTVGPSATGMNFTGSEGVRLSVEAVDGAAAETGANTGLLRLTRTGATTTAMTVYVDLQGDAALTTDYTLSPAADTTTVSPIESVTIAVGQSTLDVTLTAVNDATREGPEVARMVLIPHSAYTIAGKAAAEVSIGDTGASGVVNRVSVVAVDADAEEAGDVGVFEVRRSGPVTAALTVNLAWDGAPNTDAVTNGSDGNLLAATVVIQAGEAAAQVVFTPTQDALVEGQETLRVTVGSSAAYGVGVPASAILRLADDDIPVVTMVAVDATAAEAGEDAGRFEVSRTGDTGAALEVPYVVGGSALHGTDYLGLAGMVVIPAGQSSATIPIMPLDDTFGEPSQTVVLQLRNDPGYLLGVDSVATVTITDNDLPVVAVGVSDGTCSEPNVTGAFRITTTGSGTGNVTVRYVVTGTAVSGTDFTALTGTLSIARNTSATVTVTPIEDALLEDAETVVLTLLPDPSYQVDVLEPDATLVIRDNDQTNTVNASFGSLSMAENGTATLFLSRTNSTGGAATTGALTVNYELSGTATAGVDFSGLTGSAVIPDAASNVSVTVTGIDDAIAEGTESLIVTLASGSYSRERRSATLQVTDTETSGFGRTLSFGARRSVATEGEAALSIPVVLSSANPTEEVTVSYGIDTNSATGSGVDVTVASGELRFAPGVTQMSIPLGIVDDALPESEEHVTLRLSQALGAQLNNAGSYHTVFVRDNEPRVSIEAVVASAYEQGAVAGRVRLRRTGPVDRTLVVSLGVSGTATSGLDYGALPASVTFGVGQRTVERTVVPVADALTEGPETVVVALNTSGQYLVSGGGVATVTVQDAGGNRAPTVRIVSPVMSEVGLPTGSGMEVEASVSDDGAAGSGSVLWTRVSGPGSVVFDQASELETAVRFSLAGRYVLRCAVVDGGGLSAQDEVTVVVGAGPEAWTMGNIGVTGSAATGAGDVSGDWVQSQGSGSGITTGTDGFHFSHVNLDGNGEVVARYEGTDGQFSNARTGLMMREGTAADARHVSLVFQGVNGSLSFNRRSTAGATVTSTTVTLPPGPRWLKLSRVGNDFNAWHSVDGEVWTRVGTVQTLAFSSGLRVGIATTSGNTARPARGLFSQVSVTGVGANVAAQVDAVLAGGETAFDVRSLTGTVNDDGQTGQSPVVGWQVVSGPEAVVLGTPTEVATSAQFAAEGNYVLRLSVDDGEVVSFDEVPVAVTFATLAFGAKQEAREEGAVSGGVMLSRGGRLDLPLVVAYAVGGSATAGVDYAGLTGTVAFAVGQSEVEIEVVPVVDSVAEGDETVTLTVQAGRGYLLPGEATASVVIKDEVLGEWLFGQFGAAANDPQVGGLGDDPDSDGLENLLELAFGTEAAGANGSPVTTDWSEVPGGPYLRMSVPKNPAVPGMVYEVQATSTLANPGSWSGAGLVIEEDSATMLRVRDETSMGSGVRRFLRVQVSMPGL